MTAQVLAESTHVPPIPQEEASWLDELPNDVVWFSLYKPDSRRPYDYPHQIVSFARQRSVFIVWHNLTDGGADTMEELMKTYSRANGWDLYQVAVARYP